MPDNGWNELSDSTKTEIIAYLGLSFLDLEDTSPLRFNHNGHIKDLIRRVHPHKLPLNSTQEDKDLAHVITDRLIKIKKNIQDWIADQQIYIPDDEDIQDPTDHESTPDVPSPSPPSFDSPNSSAPSFVSEDNNPANNSYISDHDQDNHSDTEYITSMENPHSPTP